MLIEKAGQRIQAMDDWRRLAPPKSAEKHWVDGRSAKETARIWLESQPDVPPEVRALLCSNPELSDIEFMRAEPEAILPFDRFSGPRNADLAIWAGNAQGPVAITVEAKADEKFDSIVGDALSAALERLIANPNSGGVARIIDLAKAIFGPVAKGQAPITALRYQLLTATAGTLAHALNMGAPRAVLVIHEFVTQATSRKLLDANAADLTAFVHRVSRGAVSEFQPGCLYGPFTLPGEPLFEEPPAFFIGKAVRKIGEPTA